MAEDLEFSQGKSLRELGYDALWFMIHATIAVVCLIVMIAVVSLFHPDPDAAGPKLFGTVLAFFVPLAVAFAVVKYRPDDTATWIWVAGLLIFAAVSVWVIDLPTGNGLCEDCAGHMLYRLQRTFFSIGHGSGLMAGAGLAVGAWVPLATFGYSLGARAALNRN